MPKLRLNCDICGKRLEAVETVSLNNDETYRSYKCGHCFILSKDFKTSNLDNVNYSAIDFSGKTARNYQVEGVNFILKSDFKCLIGDQMRLGKTPQSLLALQNAIKDKTFGTVENPCLIIVGGANIWQWVREYKTWTDSLPNGIFPIVEGSKQWIPPGFSSYIISRDTFSRKGMKEKLGALGFKLLIVDESHSFKNGEANRSQALVEFIRDYGIKHFIFLSGTSVINRADEYFTVLNLLDPAEFSSLDKFRKAWLEKDEKGKWARVNRFRIEEFREKIAPYVLRREWADVYADIDKTKPNRMFQVVKIESDHMKKIYNAALDVLAEKQAEGAGQKVLSAGLMTLRRIVGMAKVKFVADYVDIFLDERDDARIAIGLHHEDVLNQLKNAIGPNRCLQLTGKDDPARKDWIMRYFQTSKERVLLINQLAGGEGMDFSYCQDVVNIERQWSSAKEEQFEARFFNPDPEFRRKNNINRITNIEYFIAQGTIDEWWYDMVEQKRQIFGETISNNFDIDQSPMDFKELLNQTLQGRL